jgi:hypothetical protein
MPTREVAKGGRVMEKTADLVIEDKTFGVVIDKSDGQLIIHMWGPWPLVTLVLAGAVLIILTLAETSPGLGDWLRKLIGLAF